MSVLNIITIGAPILRQPARPLTAEELATDRWQAFVDDLIETMRAAHGAGLAANQVGESVRICAVEVGANNPRYPYKPPIPLTILVNPKVSPIGDETYDNYEGCLSVPNLRGVVQRHARIRITYLDRHGKKQEEEVYGWSAGTLQHECDHLDGKLFVDRVTDSSTLCTWENFDRYHKDDFVARLQEQFG